MIEDLSRADAPREESAAVCVVGAGPAGITLALDLARAGLSVCLLESGGFELDWDTLYRLNDGEAVGHTLGLGGRGRNLGGSSAQWAGRMARLDPEDFGPRPWAGSPGWPVSPKDLAPFYAAAEKVCGCTTTWVPDEEILKRNLPDQDWNWTGPLRPFVWRYRGTGKATAQDWGTEFRQDLEATPNLKVILNANVHGFETGKGRLAAVTATSLNGRTVRVAADRVVFAAGGMETVRLLLALQETAPKGFIAGEASLGRYFQQHPRALIGRVECDAKMQIELQRTFNTFVRPGKPQFEVGFALSQDLQREEGLLNCGAVLRYEPDPDSAWELMKAVIRREPKRARKRGLGLADLTNFLDNLWRSAVLKRHSIHMPWMIGVMADLEQRCDPNSRISLSSERDEFGVRKIVVDWRVSAEERETSRRFVKYLDAKFTQMGIGHVTPEPWLDEGASFDNPPLMDNAHHLGGARMGTSAKDAVVDPDLKVFGVDNLYVASGAVFPSGGHANPTLTIVTMAVRLAAHLKATAGGKHLPKARIPASA